MQYRIKSDEYYPVHQWMVNENTLNHVRDYVHHPVRLMHRYLTNVHQLVHLIMGNCIQSNSKFDFDFEANGIQRNVPDDLFYDEIQR